MEYCSTIFFSGKNITITFGMLVRTCNLIAFLAVLQVAKEHVDSCKSEHEFPHCELTAEWIKQDQVPSRLERKVTVKGAKEPYSYFHIVLDSTPTGNMVLGLDSFE